MPFEFERLGIPDVIVIRPHYFSDGRGFFAETYKKSDFGKFGIEACFIQDNHSRSQKGVLRGLHYQLSPFAQGKLLRVVRGAVFDVAVDIRKGSPTFGTWVSAVLSVENRCMLWVPPGFAHGFLTLEDDTDVLYKTTEEYAPGHERGIIWNDPDLAVVWPMENPILSPRDQVYPGFRDAEINYFYGEKP